MIYIDVDGVVAAFDEYIVSLSGTEEIFNDSKALYKLMDDNYETCFLNSPTTKHSDYFFNLYHNNDNVKFLTSGGNHWSSRGRRLTIKQNKIKWLSKYNVSSRDVIITNTAEEKLEYCNEGDILYDDRFDTIYKWNKKGGLGILVYNRLIYDRYYK